MSLVPFYQSEKNFRRFEGVLCDALACYPTPIKVRSTLNGLSNASLATQINNAIKYHVLNAWPSKVVDWVEFLKVHDDLGAYFNAEGVVVGSKKGAKLARAEAYETEVTGNTSKQKVVEGPIDPLAITAFATLLHFRLIDSVKITNTPLNCLPHAESYDVEIMKDGDGVIIM